MAISRNLDFIDALRGLASLVIIVFHLVTVSRLETPGTSILLLGKTGVLLFFLISGFTIYLSLESRMDGVINFYIRRFLRIAPLFYIILVIQVGLIYYLCVPYCKFPSTQFILLNITFLFNFFPQYVWSIVGAGWTIGVEMPFYLIAPFFCRICTNLRRTALFLGLTTGISYIFLMLSPRLIKPSLLGIYTEESIFCNLPIFLVGFACYIVHREHLSAVHHRKGAASVLFLAFIFLMFAPISEGKLRYTMQVCAYAALVIALALMPTRMLVNRVTRFYGKISYSTYLIHPLVLYNSGRLFETIYQHIAFSKAVAFICCAASAIAMVTLLAVVSHRLIEMQGIRFGRWLIAKHNSPGRRGLSYHL